MQPNDLNFLAKLTFFAVVYVVLKTIIKSATKHDGKPFKEKFTIVYPLEPASVNFDDIMNEIDKCRNGHHLNGVYQRIILFQGCYSERGDLLHDLWEAYERQQDYLHIYN